jgi:hypothetical protein
MKAIMKYRIMQMLRAPLMAGAFFLLLAASAAFFAIGANMWQAGDESLRELEKGFHTVGSFRQVPDQTEREARWHGDTMSYTYGSSPAFGGIVQDIFYTGHDLGFVREPRLTPYYYALNEKINISSDAYDGDTGSYLQRDYWLMHTPIMEIQAESDASIGQPVAVRVGHRLMGGGSLEEGGRVNVFDYSNPEPITLEAGKTYAASLNETPISFMAYEGEWGLNDIAFDLEPRGLCTRACSRRARAAST